jgi:hypothetical protein
MWSVQSYKFARSYNVTKSICVAIQNALIEIKIYLICQFDPHEKTPYIVYTFSCFYFG